MTSGLRFAYRFIETREATLVSFVDIKIGVIGLDGPGGKDYPFEYQMRPVLDQNAILKATRLVFTGVANDITRRDSSFGCDGPLPADRKRSTSTTQQTAVCDFVENSFRRGILAESFISASTAVFVERFGFSRSAVGKEYHDLF